MKFITASFLVLLCACSARGEGEIVIKSTAAPVTENPVTVLVGGKIYTMNDAQPTADALAYDTSGKILWVGGNEDAEIAAKTGAKIIDLGGAIVLPGFHDVHLHALEAGINEGRCVLSEFGTPKQYKNEIATCAFDQSAADWFIGAGVSMPDLLEQIAMPVDFLDGLFPDKPALILDNLGHGAWANSPALKAVRYDTMTGNPPGGIIDRNADGRPTGIVYENAQQVLRTAALPPTKANREVNYLALRTALKTLAAHGITSVSDAGGYWPRGHHLAWIRAEKEGVLTVRASNGLYVFPDRDIDEQIAHLITLKISNKNNLAKFNQVKIYVDGILSLGTAALYEPYAQDFGVAGKYGFEYFSKPDLFAYARRLDAAGFSLHFHAVGDRGVGLALDAVEAAQKANGLSANRHRLTHIFLAAPADHARFAALGVTADLQMTPSTFDPQTIAFYKRVIGGRVNGLVPLDALMSANAPITISSDWDADELSPLVKIGHILSRSGETGPGVNAAVAMMTIDSAKLLGQDDLTGSLEAGKYADMAVLDKDIFSLPISHIKRTKILVTIMNGDVVYDPHNKFKQGTK